MISMELFEQELFDADDYVCVNPDIGRRLPEYRDHALTDAQQQSFEHHLLFCQKCQDDLAYFQWLVDALKSRRAETNAARLADAIALEMAWEPLAQTACGMQQEHTFQLADGRIEVICQWESPKAQAPGYIVIWWQADIESERELAIQFFRTDTREILYEEEIGAIRNSHATFTFDELGFDPEHEQWAIAIV